MVWAFVKDWSGCRGQALKIIIRLNNFYLFIKPKWARSIFILILPGSVQRVKEVSKNPSGIEGKKVIV